MTVQEILNSTFTKTKKAILLFEAGYTRRDVANWITNGNYGFAHNIWKKWDDSRIQNTTPQQAEFTFQFNRTFGIELEIFGPTREQLISAFQQQGITLVSQDYNHITSTDWKIVRDGSISGSNGNEIVSPILSGLDGLDQIKKVTIALNKVKAQVNTSCGFHVHFGANDFTLENFKSLAKNHIQLEKDFDAIVPESRRANKNSYCKSLTASFRTKNLTMEKINSATTVNELIRQFPSRYVKLNFQSFVRQGTIEVRHHSGTTTFSKIKNWILICARMMEYSKANLLTNNIKDILNESLQDYFEDRKVDLAA